MSKITYKKPSIRLIVAYSGNKAVGSIRTTDGGVVFAPYKGRYQTLQHFKTIDEAKAYVEGESHE